MAVAEQIGIRPRATPAGVQRRSIDARVALPVILYFMAVMLPLKFDLGPIDMTGVRVVLIVLILPLTIQLLMGRFGRILLTDILFFLHYAWIVVVLAINNPQQVVSSSGSTGIEFLGGYILGRACIRTPADFAGLIKLLTLLALCTLPFALYETMTGTAIILRLLNALPVVFSLPDLSLGQRMGLDRVQMVFVHPIHYGLFCTMALSLCFVGLKGLYSDTLRWIVAGVIMACGFLALSSGAFLAILMQLILIVWAWTFRGTRARWWILLGVIVVSYVAIDLLSNRTPLRVFLSYATFSPHTAYMRSIIFDWGMINVWANPIFGLGLNDWVRPRFMVSGSMDNFWLVIAVRYGIPGFLLLAGGYLIALWKIGRRDFDSDPLLWQFRRAWMFCFAGLTFTLCTVHVWETIYSLTFFMFGAGMWMLTFPVQPAAGVPAAGPARDRAGPAARRRAGPDPAGPPEEKPAAPPERSGPRYTRFPGSRPPAR